MKQADLERKLREIEWPVPAADLRARVLAVATAAADVAPAAITWSDRVWFSRAWRVAALATVVGAIAVDSLWGTAHVPSAVPGERTLADVQAIDEVGREVGLPADVSASLARRALLADNRRNTPDVQGHLALEAADREGERR